MLHPNRVPDFLAREPFPVGGKVDTRHPGHRGHYASAAILQHHLWKQILYVEAHNTDEDIAREQLGVSRYGFVAEEEQGIYVPGVKSTEAEYKAWESDESYLDETSWGSSPEEAEVIPRVISTTRPRADLS